MSRQRIVAGVIALLAAGCVSPAPEPIDPEVHRAQIQEWRQWRDDELSRPDGWLSLAGLYWLQEGGNSFGADPTSDLVVEIEGVPPLLGEFQVAGEHVDFIVAGGAEVTVQGQPVQRVVARTDEEGAERPVIEWGSLSWFVLERGDRIGVRMKDTGSPILVGFEGVDSYAIAPEWRLVGRLEPYDPPRTIKVPNILGTVNDVESSAAAVFELDGQTYRMDLWRDSLGDTDWFTAFGDATNGEATYGGGRFVRIDPPDEHGHLVIDFNRAYNPPCVFTPFATCPLPPRQNRLELGVEAGELDFRAH